MKSINLTAVDLAANRQNRLSDAQRRLLGRERLLALAGSIGFAAGLLGLPALLYLRAANPDFADRGQLFIWLPIGLFWLGLLWPSVNKFRYISQDLQTGQVALAEGDLQADMSTNFGLLKILKYYLYIDRLRFQVSRELFRQLKAGERYRIYYAPRSKAFLGAVPFIAPAAYETDVVETAVLLDPLTEREQEILQFIAAGLSNKEIAAQLSLSPNTVKMYASQLYSKLGVSRRTEAVARGKALGLVK